MAADNTAELTPEQLAEIERKYDPETAFRPTGKTLGFVIAGFLVAMSVYHFYASGFGLIRELLHRGIHLSFVLGLVFLLFGLRKTDPVLPPKAWYRLEGVPLVDIALAILGVTAAMYLPLLPPEIVSQRVGNPAPSDIFMGTALLLLVLEATRRSVGPTLPIIGLCFIAFAYFGPYMPGALKHGGSSWLGIVNHLYMTNQGIYGIALGVMAQYVFLFVLFGALAMRVGLGQLFIDLSMVGNDFWFLDCQYRNDRGFDDPNNEARRLSGQVRCSCRGNCLNRRPNHATHSWCSSLHYGRILRNSSA